MVIAFGILFAAAPFAAAQAAEREAKTAEQQYKNIKVLRGTPAESFNQTMHLISGSLGVDCEYCHLQKDRVSDELENKRTARKMMRMMIDLNKKSFDGKQVVTCYTCHRGNPVPPDSPALPVGDYVSDEKPPAAQLPTVDQILAKYVEALGGEQAILKVTSRVITATQDIPSGPGGVNQTPAETERYQKAPYMVLNVWHAPKYTITNGFDGSVSWAQDVRGRVGQPVKLEQMRSKRAADFYECLHLKQEYTQMKVDGITKVNNHEAYLVIGYPEEKIPEKLYFDKETGLLLRKSTVVPTAAGSSPYRVDYDDYRDTGSGVKYPFLIHMEPASPRLELVSHSTIHVLKVQDNVAIEDAKFVKPLSKEEPPAKVTAGAGAARRSTAQ
jgi:photosynthetic reaction center cytochrome c subunit